MVAIFLLVFAAIGLFLHYPILSDGLFTVLTSPVIESRFSHLIEQFSSGYQRPDGIALAVVTLIVFLSAFLRTTRGLLNTRLFLIALISAVFSAELFFAITRELAFHTYTGLLYSVIFLFLAFIASIFRVGSMKSLNSTLMGKPQTEGSILSQTFSRFLSRATHESSVQVTAVDPVSSDLAKGQKHSFKRREIKIGRDAGWADLLIGEQWGSVSSRHARLRLISQALIYEPISSRYAYAINEKPVTETREVPDHSTLTLVSGDGPRISVQLQKENQSLIHPRSMARAGHIARDEFKRVQTSFKLFLVIVLLGLPLFFIFRSLEGDALDRHLAAYDRQQQEISRELKSKVSEIDRLEQADQKKERLIHSLKERIARIQREETAEDSSAARTEKQPTRSRETRQAVDRLAKIIDIKFTSQRISIYFPAVTVNNQGGFNISTAFFARLKNRPLIFAEAQGVRISPGDRSSSTLLFIYPETWKNFQSFLRKLTAQERSARRDTIKQLMSFARRANLIIIPVKRWKKFRSGSGTRSLVSTTIDDFPGYLHDFIPALSHDLSRNDRIVVYGFHDGHKRYTPLTARSIQSTTIITNRPQRSAPSSGFLVKVDKAGHYSVVGVCASDGSTGQRGLFRFHRI